MESFRTEIAGTRSKITDSRSISKEFRDDFVLAWLASIGREAEVSSDVIEYSAPTDVSAVSMPKYITDQLCASYDDQYKRIEDDFLSMVDVRNELASVRSLKKNFNEFTSLLRTSQNSGTLSNYNKHLYSEQIKSSEAEMSKAQLLHCNPSYHTANNVGNHFFYHKPPESFDKGEFCKIASVVSNYLKSVIDKHRLTKTKVVLPLLTSQGVLLKGKRETAHDRTLSKALHSAIALKANSRQDIDRALRAIGSVFTSLGYFDPSKSFTTGVRRQHSNKIEPIINSFVAKGYTVGLQGRIRGIFPAPEVYKVFYKKTADVLKKALFNHSPCFFVEPYRVSRSINKISLLSFKYSLFDDESNVCAYDLSQYDRTQHSGLNDLYIKIVQDCGLISKDDDMFSQFSLLSVQDAGKREIYSEAILGRSTLSGQPDVTVKNNIIHLMVMVYCLTTMHRDDSIYSDAYLGWARDNKIDLKRRLDYDTVLEDVINNSNGISAHIHGDDTILFFSPVKDHYYKYLAVMKNTGIIGKHESVLSFLKKTPKIISSEIEVSGLSMNQIEELVQTFVPESSRFESTTNPIIGSLMRNRYGEYAKEYPLLFLAGLVDIANLFKCDYYCEHLKERLLDELSWFESFLRKSRHLSPASRLLLDSSEFKKFKETLEEDLDLLHASEDLKRLLSLLIEDSFDKTISEAHAIRSYLDRLYFAAGQRTDVRDLLSTDNSQSDADNSSEMISADDEFAASLYGMLNYEAERLADEIGLLQLDFDELITLVSDIQKILIESEGSWNEVKKAYPFLFSAR